MVENPWRVINKVTEETRVLPPPSFVADDKASTLEEDVSMSSLKFSSHGSSSSTNNQELETPSIENLRGRADEISTSERNKLDDLTHSQTVNLNQNARSSESRSIPQPQTYKTSLSLDPASQSLRSSLNLAIHLTGQFLDQIRCTSNSRAALHAVNSLVASLQALLQGCLHASYNVTKRAQDYEKAMKDLQSLCIQQRQALRRQRLQAQRPHTRDACVDTSLHPHQVDATVQTSTEQGTWLDNEQIDLETENKALKDQILVLERDAQLGAAERRLLGRRAKRGEAAAAAHRRRARRLARALPHLRAVLAAQRRFNSGLDPDASVDDIVGSKASWSFCFEDAPLGIEEEEEDTGDDTDDEPKGLSSLNANDMLETQEETTRGAISSSHLPPLHPNSKKPREHILTGLEDEDGTNSEDDENGYDYDSLSGEEEEPIPKEMSEERHEHGSVLLQASGKIKASEKKLAYKSINKEEKQSGRNRETGAKPGPETKGDRPKNDCKAINPEGFNLRLSFSWPPPLINRQGISLRHSSTTEENITASGIKSRQRQRRRKRYEDDSSDTEAAGNHLEDGRVRRDERGLEGRENGRAGSHNDDEKNASVAQQQLCYSSSSLSSPPLSSNDSDHQSFNDIDGVGYDVGCDDHDKEEEVK